MSSPDCSGSRPCCGRPPEPSARPLPGIDDYPKKTEVTSLPDAQAMLGFAQANGMNLLSIWAIQRDNGGCPGTRDNNTCSGISQGTWDFSHALEPFTG